MKSMRSIALAALLVVICHTELSAAQLRVEPVLIDLTAPAAAATLTLRNEQDDEVTIQTRVFKWSQSAGKETLEPTTDVVASPPAVTLAPHADYVVRVVRVTKEPVHGEESYRVIVDQLPRSGKQRNTSLNLLIRQSIPVFFRQRVLDVPEVAWSIGYDKGKLIVTASNTGDERLRIASLRLKDSSGATVAFGNGLLGYVLGHSTMKWISAAYPRGFGAGGSISVTAETDKGPTRAVVQSQLQ
jgi:fimbrial chaperone protein